MQAIVDQEGVRRYLVSLTINGDPQTAMVKANTVLVNLLREEYDLTGTKKGCELGDCGSCTILLDGRPVNSCLVLALEADGSEIVTVEGLTERGELDRVQQAFLDKAAVQCGYCTPGMILSAKALLDRNPDPTEEEIREAIAGNLCRCTGYVNIVRAIKAAAGQEASTQESTGRESTGRETSGRETSGEKGKKEQVAS